jgi:nitroimidazol reductase NimA-like FMN-containing flavoprotein (pyridoxamine 5'-phosphate oxidase superfamily)
MTDTKAHEPHRSRPQMKDYGIHTGTEGMMTWAEITPKLEQSRNYWICSTQPDGKPSASPVWGVWLDGTLYFSCGKSSRKGRNLANNPHVAVHLESGDDAVMLEGKVEELTDTTVYAKVREVYGKKYPFTPEADLNPANYWFTLKLDTAFAWLEADFPRTATRWTFDE